MELCSNIVTKLSTVEINCVCLAWAGVELVHVSS